MSIVKGFKGFNKNLQCVPDGTPFQYETGKEYDTDCAKCCNSGFHFCAYPLSVFNYYPPANSRYCEVEASGQMDTDADKTAATHIKIGAELSLHGIIEAAIKFTFDRSKPETGGIATGYQGAASATGYQGAASATGVNSFACGLGYQCKAAASVGSWLVLSEWNDEGNEILDVKTFKVDGVTIKECVFYMLRNGELIEIE